MTKSSGIRVLLVSDQAIEIEDLRDFLTRAGVQEIHEMAYAPDVSDALRAHTLDIDLAFVGLRDSVAVSRCIAALTASECKVVAINGIDISDQSGDVANLPRPFNDHTLRNILTHLGVVL